MATSDQSAILLSNHPKLELREGPGDQEFLKATAEAAVLLFHLVVAAVQAEHYLNMM
jgi:hypothetical protein